MVLFEYPLRGRTKGDYEEDEDVGDVIGESSRPFCSCPRPYSVATEGAVFLTSCSYGSTLPVTSLCCKASSAKQVCGFSG